MGGFFGVVSKHDAISDTFFGTDYHSHLGTRRGGMAAYSPRIGLQREIHNIENAPFRTKFEHVFKDMEGTSAIGCISDTDPQPLLIRSNLGTYAISIIGIINNMDQLIDQFLTFSGGHFDAMTGGKINTTELVAAMINQKSSFVEGIAFAQNAIEGTCSILILRDNGNIIAARDRLGRIPVLVAQGEDGYCVSFESFAYQKQGYELCKELGPGEIVEITTEGVTQLKAPGKEMKVCAFLWTYFGYPTATYEGVNVEVMRYRNGQIMARDEMAAGTHPEVDYVAGVPDSGIPHAIGYSNQSYAPFARPYVKYTPTWSRSFTPSDQRIRSQVAEKKQIPVPELIQGKKLLLVDDSIVRGTQLQATVDFLYESGAKEVHMRSACPPIMYSCKYLNFSRGNSDMDLLARRVIQELEGDEGQKHIEEYADSKTERGQCLLRSICRKFGFDSLGYQSLEGVLEAIGIDKEKICTYCWNGKE